MLNYNFPPAGANKKRSGDMVVVQDHQAFRKNPTLIHQEKLDLFPMPSSDQRPEEIKAIEYNNDI
jgi:hypothetical protein